MSLQIKGKFIRLEHGESLKIRSADGLSEISLIGINGAGKVEVQGEEVAIKSVVDAAIADETAARTAALSQVASAAQAAIQAETTTRMAADTALQGEVNAVEADLAQEILDRQSGDTDTLASANTYTDTEVASLQSQINTLTGGTSGISLTTLDGRLDILEGNSTVVGSVAKAEADAKAYADQKIADLVDSAPELLDTLNELAAALGDDPNFASSITSVISNGDAATLASAKTYTDGKVAVVQGEVDAVELALSNEITRATSAENALGGRLNILEGGASVEGSVAKAEQDAKDYADAAVAAEAVLRDAADVALDERVSDLEAVAHRKMKFVLSATDISNGYVTLGHEAMSKSTVASVGRLMIQEDDDYTVSVVGGVTRLTFIGSLVDPGNEKLAAGDVVFVKYMA
jgi:hypothetical protein